MKVTSDSDHHVRHKDDMELFRYIDLSWAAHHDLGKWGLRLTRSGMFQWCLRKQCMKMHENAGKRR